LFALQDRLEEIFGCKVDLGTPNGLKAKIKRPNLKRGNLCHLEDGSKEYN
jgi:predicted nucleotidyltransferase